LKELCAKYDFKYPEDKLIALAKAVHSGFERTKIINAGVDKVRRE
jgi:hypothetical protein